MTVYVDEVFVLNTVVNYLLLRTAATLTGTGGVRWRLWLAALGGGAYAVLVLVPGLGWLGSPPGELFAFAGLCLTAFGWRGAAWKSALWFFGICCAFGGLVLAATALLRVPVLWRGGRVYYRVTLRLLILLAGGVYLLCSLCLRRFARHRGAELVRLELTLDGRTLGCDALRDNGATLRDPMTGQAVPVIGWQLGLRLLPGLGLGRADFAAPAELLRALRLLRPGLCTRLIPYRAVGTEGGLLLAIRVDEIRVNGTALPARFVAVSPTTLSDGGVYEAVVNQPVS